MLFSFANHTDADVNAVDGERCTRLHYLAGQRKPAEVQALLNRGANVNAQCSTLAVPLHMAALVGDIETVTVLLSSTHIKVDIRDQLGETPLYIASRFGHVNVVRALIQKGANPDVQNISGETPLHIGALNKNFEVVKILVLEGQRATVNLRSLCGQTPLDKAELGRSQDLITFLKSNGAIKGSFTEEPFFTPFNLLPKFEPTMDSTSNLVIERP